ncbi:MAG: Isopentenyl-diphosphate delta-isomerase [Tenericutes bacterium ADurb.Bin024]|nr:MAG: Isopentenyl-diphosphate delta-isomerase [Tenericutes bacterium ADurb.Bin024]
MSRRRKDEHIAIAKMAKIRKNDFSHIRFIHHSIPSLSLKDIDLSTSFLGHKFNYPFYINAMTGGAKKGDKINAKLAILAQHFGLPLFVGSQSLAFKNKESRLAFETLRFNFPDLFIVANINPNFTAEMASDAVEILGANALAIHVNSIQELVMGEGDRDFTKWKDNIANILKTVKVPVIVKEVGYGMHEPTLLLLQELGVKHIDISGMGGINFSLIELKRQKKKDSPLLDFGISTVDALLLARNYPSFEVLASGGINNASSIIKSLAMGAKAAGMAKYFLDLCNLPVPEMIKKVDELIIDLKKILVLLNVKSVRELNLDHLMFDL